MKSNLKGLFSKSLTNFGQDAERTAKDMYSKACCWHPSQVYQVLSALFSELHSSSSWYDKGFQIFLSIVTIYIEFWFSFQISFCDGLRSVSTFKIVACTFHSYSKALNADGARIKILPRVPLILSAPLVFALEFKIIKGTKVSSILLYICFKYLDKFSMWLRVGNFENWQCI